MSASSIAFNDWSRILSLQRINGLSFKTRNGVELFDSGSTETYIAWIFRLGRLLDTARADTLQWQIAMFLNSAEGLRKPGSAFRRSLRFCRLWSSKVCPETQLNLLCHNSANIWFRFSVIFLAYLIKNIWLFRHFFCIFWFSNKYPVWGDQNKWENSGFTKNKIRETIWWIDQ